MYKITTAFSLTELMIVVAIAAFISAIAIPNYKIYINKANVTDMISTMDPCQVQVYQYFLQNGSFPDGSTVPVTCYGQTIPSGSMSAALKEGITASYTVSGTNTSNNYYADFTVNHPSVMAISATGASTTTPANLHIRLKQTNATSAGGGGDLQYQCGVVTSDPNQVPSKYLPSACTASF